MCIWLGSPRSLTLQQYCLLLLERPTDDSICASGFGRVILSPIQAVVHSYLHQLSTVP